MLLNCSKKRSHACNRVLTESRGYCFQSAFPSPNFLAHIPRQTSRADYSSLQRPQSYIAWSISSPARSAAPLLTPQSDLWAGSECSGYWAAHRLAVAYWLSLAAEDCERLPTAFAMGPAAGQAPSRPRLRHHSESVDVVCATCIERGAAKCLWGSVEGFNCWMLAFGGACGGDGMVGLSYSLVPCRAPQPDAHVKTR